MTDQKPAYDSTEYRKAHKTNPRINHPVRRCIDCGLTTTAAGMGNHLKASSHAGYEKERS